MNARILTAIALATTTLAAQAAPTVSDEIGDRSSVTAGTRFQAATNPMVVAGEIGFRGDATASTASRAAIQAQLQQAIRDGVLPAVAETGATERDLNPGRHAGATGAAPALAIRFAPLVQAAPGWVDGEIGYRGRPDMTLVTRAQVQAELQQATRAGDLPAVAETGDTERELNPTRYPSAAQPSLSREQVKAELADALRQGQVRNITETGAIIVR